MRSPVGGRSNLQLEQAALPAARAERGSEAGDPAVAIAQTSQVPSAFFQERLNVRLNVLPIDYANVGGCNAICHLAVGRKPPVRCTLDAAHTMYRDSPQRPGA